MLSVDKLSKQLPDGTLLLDNLSFTAEAGEFIAILGASGAGKSLTLRCILGLTQATSGDISFRDRDGFEHNLTTRNRRELRAARARLGTIFQGLNLVKGLRVVENVMLGRLGEIPPWRSWLIGFTDDEAFAAVDALAATNMAQHADRFTGSLSGGEMQRVAISRAIYQQPDIYLADEPVSSLDPGNANAIMTLLRPLAEEKPVIGVFHQPDLVAKHCTRAICIRKGRIVYDGAPQLDEATLTEIYGAELVKLREKDAA